MRAWSLAEKTVLPDPEGPARPTTTTPLLWEVRVWTARMKTNRP
jgi:hypothetical protein